MWGVASESDPPLSSMTGEAVQQASKERAGGRVGELAKWHVSRADHPLELSFGVYGVGVEVTGPTTVVIGE